MQFVQAPTLPPVLIRVAVRIYLLLFLILIAFSAKTLMVDLWNRTEDFAPFIRSIKNQFPEPLCGRHFTLGNGYKKRQTTHLFPHVLNSASVGLL